MINQRLIYKIIGSLLLIEAVFMSICLLVAFYYHEDDMPAFVASMIITTLAGLALRYMGRENDNTLSRRDAYLVVTLTWIVFSLLGTLPFLVSGYMTNFTDAYFETMSGFTTTGATVINCVERLPHGLLFWRSFTQWIGGLGIVFFTIALLPSLVSGSTKVFSAEATGPIKTKLHPRLSTNAKWIWVVYVIITLACMACLYAAGMGWFASVNYAMTSAATGGFTTLSNNSLLTPMVQYILTLFCFVSGINFTILYASLAKLRPQLLLKNSEFRFYLVLILACTVFVMTELMLHNGYQWKSALRTALFHVVSFITTTGIIADNAQLWPHVTWIVLAICMFFGACSGSTSGGIKCVRGVMLLKTIRNEFRQILHPNAVLPLRVDGSNVPFSKRVTLLAFLSTYLLLSLFGMVSMISLGISHTNAITITLSCISNVGPTLGLDIGNPVTWSTLPVVAKWICSALMLIGRLEIFSVLVIFTPAFWDKR